MASGTIKNTQNIGNTFMSMAITSEYTQNNPFIAPCDGYVYSWTEPNVTSGSLVIRYGNTQSAGLLSQSLLARSDGKEVRQALFVKQGTSVFFHQNSFADNTWGVSFRGFY